MPCSVDLLHYPATEAPYSQAKGKTLAASKYVEQVRNHPDPPGESVKILRTLANNVGQTGALVTEVYNALLRSKLVTTDDLKARAFYITEVAVRFRKHYNLFREVRLEHVIREEWKEDWDLDFGLKKTPSRDILEVIVKIATKMTMAQTLEGLSIAGWKPGSKPTKKHFEFVQDYVLPSVVAGSGIPKSTGKLAISAPGKLTPEVAIRGSISGSGEPTCELAAEASGKSLHDSTARSTESRGSAVLNAPGNLDGIRARGPGEPGAVLPASEAPAASNVFSSSEVPPACAVPPEAHRNEPSAAPPLPSRGLPLGAREIPDVLKGLPYTTICMRQTLSQFEDQAALRTPVDTTESDWNQFDLTLGNVLMLSSDRYILAVKLDPIGEDQTAAMSHAFERLRRVWAHKRKVNTKDSRRARIAAAASASRPNTTSTASSRALTRKRTRRTRTIRRPCPYIAPAPSTRLDEREAVVTNTLPPPPASDHRHHDYIAIKGGYGHSRCGVFHLCYWIPTGQEPNGPCLSAHIQSGSYRADAVGKFLRACQSFQKTAADVSQSFPVLPPDLDEIVLPGRPSGSRRISLNSNTCANVDVTSSRPYMQ